MIVELFLFGTLAELREHETFGTQLLTRTLGEIDLPKAFLVSLIPSEPRLGLFYTQPKLHKASAENKHFPLGCPARPITSIINHPVSGLSAWVHALLAPAMNNEFIAEYTRDTLDVLRTLEALRTGEYSIPQAVHRSQRTPTRLP